MMKASTLLIWLFLSVSRASQEYKIYFQHEGKKLTATQINSVVNKQAMDCLNVCLFDVRCEAFNAYKSDDDVDMCDFFDKDRCSAGVSLVDSATGSAYFDKLGKLECPTHSPPSKRKFD